MQIKEQLNCCQFCGKWFGEWKVIIYSDDTVERQCPYCLAYPLNVQENDQVK